MAPTPVRDPLMKWVWFALKWTHFHMNGFAQTRQGWYKNPLKRSCRITKRFVLIHISKGIACTIATKISLFHLLRQTALTARETLVKNYSITDQLNWSRESKLCAPFKAASVTQRDTFFKKINWYKYNDPLTVDSYNLLMIAISAISITQLVD